LPGHDRRYQTQPKAPLGRDWIEAPGTPAMTGQIGCGLPGAVTDLAKFS